MSVQKELFTRCGGLIKKGKDIRRKYMGKGRTYLNSLWKLKYCPITYQKFWKKYLNIWGQLKDSFIQQNENQMSIKAYTNGK